MGFFRRYKLSDYTADECREEMEQLVYDITGCEDFKRIDKMMTEWGCYRELLARHEGKNKSQLDT